jgi:3-dehydroquinate synthase
MTTALTIDVPLTNSPYQIIIAPGARHQLGNWLQPQLAHHCNKLAIISNKQVFDYYGRDLLASLTATGYQTSYLLLPDGERYKTLSTVTQIYDHLIAQRLGRQDSIIALGGGVIGDIVGFAAATYLRGIGYIQVPTTLLAQIDSSIGGKTGVNHRSGKNLIGAFHQPQLVVIDPETLATLPPREIRAALQEVIKYAIIADPELFHILQTAQPAIEQQETTLLTDIIARCCRIKTQIVLRDEKEAYERQVLNLGHTLGHALEAATSYRRFKHGEAVGYGIIFAAIMAVKMGLLSAATSQKITSIVLQYGPLPAWQDLAIDSIMAALSKDKKSLQGQPTLILPTAIGQVIIQQFVEFSAIKDVIELMIKGGSYARSSLKRSSRRRARRG